VRRGLVLFRVFNQLYGIHDERLNDITPIVAGEEVWLWPTKRLPSIALGMCRRISFLATYVVQVRLRRSVRAGREIRLCRSAGLWYPELPLNDRETLAKLVYVFAVPDFAE